MIMISKLNILNFKLENLESLDHCYRSDWWIGNSAESSNFFYLFPGFDEKIPGFQCANDPTVSVCLVGHLNIEHRERRREGGTHISSVMLFAPLFFVTSTRMYESLWACCWRKDRMDSHLFHLHLRAIYILRAEIPWPFSLSDVSFVNTNTRGHIVRRFGCGLKITEQHYLCYLVMSQGGQVCFFWQICGILWFCTHVWFSRSTFSESLILQNEAIVYISKEQVKHLSINQFYRF